MFRKKLQMVFWLGKFGGGMAGGFVLRTTCVSPLDRDKDILSLTRGKCGCIFPVWRGL